MSTFYRTEALKTTHYLSNGEGRDSYISVNNGGISRNKYPISFKEEGRVTRRIFLPGSPILPAKPIKYKANGTGRDSYIGSTHGGLISQYSKFSFYNTLRQSAPSPIVFYCTTPNSFQFAKRNKESLSQQRTSLRLSVPKYKFESNKRAN